MLWRTLNPDTDSPVKTDALQGQVSELIRTGLERLVMPRYRNLGAGEVMLKDGTEKVTVADREMEAHLTEGLQRLLPSSEVVGEEGFAERPEAQRRGLAEGDPVWILDPIDGTSNFVGGSPRFCSMVCLVEGQRVTMSWIFAPALGWEAMACDREGVRGVWKDGEPLGARTPPSMAPGDWIGQINWRCFKESPRARAEMTGRFQSLRRVGCVGVDLVEQALGVSHFSLYRRLCVWDHAPGVLLLRLAGGMVAGLNASRPYQVRETGYFLLTAAHERIGAQVRDMAGAFPMNFAED